MAIMAAACGILIAALGFWSTRGHADGIGALTAIVCLVGGLILCFVAVLLSRVAALGRRLDDFEERRPVQSPPAVPRPRP